MRFAHAHACAPAHMCRNIAATFPTLPTARISAVSAFPTTFPSPSDPEGLQA
jgi:hypothetical protein